MLTIIKADSNRHYVVRYPTSFIHSTSFVPTCASSRCTCCYSLCIKTMPTILRMSTITTIPFPECSITPQREIFTLIHKNLLSRACFNQTIIKLNILTHNCGFSSWLRYVKNSFLEAFIFPHKTSLSYS